MAQEIALGHLSAVPPGEGRTFALNGIRVAIFHTRAGRIFATQAQCPHRGGPLADGLTDAVSVVCPLHDRIYDLSSGNGIGTECRIQTYPVRVDDGGTILMVPEPHPAMETVE